MTVVYDPTVRESIDAAFAHAEAGNTAVALQYFSLSRSQALNLADPEVLSQKIEQDQAAYTREREKYRAILSTKPEPSRLLLILADSLGLPRPNDKTGEDEGASRTYSGLISAKYANRSVTSICQRFYTTSSIRKLLSEDDTLGQDSDVIIHLGLNDCANRMFLEPERISLSLLEKETREKIVEFARVYRRDILRGLPAHHYTSIELFRENLDMIVSVLKSRRARRIILTTIILPPARSWPGTPGMNRNFAIYNLEIMNAAHRHEIDLFDLDRHIWQAQNRNVLLPDGMHLSDAGHELFVAKCDPFIR